MRQIKSLGFAKFAAIGLTAFTFGVSLPALAGDSTPPTPTTTQPAPDMGAAGSRPSDTTGQQPGMQPGSQVTPNAADQTTGAAGSRTNEHCMKDGKEVAEATSKADCRKQGGQWSKATDESPTSAPSGTEQQGTPPAAEPGTQQPAGGAQQHGGMTP